MREALTINNTVIKPGGRAVIDIPIPKLFTHTQIPMPLHVIRGKKDGPTIFVTAAVHGDELNGIEITRRLLVHPALNRLRGTLFVVPIVNLYGVLSGSRYLPDRRDLNRSFPGSPSGSMASRLANTLMVEVVGRCDFGIDLHTGAIHRSNLPQVRGDFSDPFLLEQAHVFGAPVLIESKLRDGSLRSEAQNRGVPILLYEAGEALRLNETAIRVGFRGVLNVLRNIGSLPKQSGRAKPEPFVALATKWLRAPESGLFKMNVRLGAKITKGDILGYIMDPINGTTFPVETKIDGIVIGQSTLPLVHEGDAVINIGSFDEDLDDVVEHVEQFVPSP